MRNIPGKASYSVAMVTWVIKCKHRRKKSKVRQNKDLTTAFSTWMFKVPEYFTADLHKVSLVLYLQSDAYWFKPQHQACLKQRNLFYCVCFIPAAYWLSSDHFLDKALMSKFCYQKRSQVLWSTIKYRACEGSQWPFGWKMAHWEQLTKNFHYFSQTLFSTDLNNATPAYKSIKQVLHMRKQVLIAVSSDKLCILFLWSSYATQISLLKEKVLCKDIITILILTFFLSSNNAWFLEVNTMHFYTIF